MILDAPATKGERMTAKTQDSEGCRQLQQAVTDQNVKIKPLQSGQKGKGKSVSYFIEILSSLKMDPCKYLKTQKKTTRCILVDSKIKDDEDGQVWDWYILYCPTGPPCYFLENL
jgi:hypothetical protein